TCVSFLGFYGFTYFHYYINAWLWRLVFVLMLVVTLHWVLIIFERYLLGELPRLSFNIERTMDYYQYINGTIRDYGGKYISVYHYLAIDILRYLKIFFSSTIIMALYIYGFRETRWKEKKIESTCIGR
ncbi:hypothetical protein MNBD_GAMMA12-3287, partial [hydrothermal vent metagenome]